MLALVLAFGVAISMLPPDVSFHDALKLAGAAGKLNAVTTTFDWNDRYNIWSGLIGGMFLALAYFGTDQSQVQRYLTGKSIGQSRLGLILTAVAKVPMQFFILFIGAMVFVVFLFVRPPLVFQPVVMEQVQASPQYAALESRYERAFDQRQAAARKIMSSDTSSQPGALQDFRAAQNDLDTVRTNALNLGSANDTNYIFLSLVTR
jgi:hypothetical protein